jgi:hypothetical protein
MASVRSAVLISATLALGFGPGLVPQAAASAKPPYEVEFDSTMVNHFSGQDNGPQGSETTEIQAQIPLTKSGSTYTGSAVSTYKQATGTISESCTEGDHGHSRLMSSRVEMRRVAGSVGAKRAT